MAASTLYLIRSDNITYAKQESVLDVFLSGYQTVYSTVTGVAATDVVTIAGATLVNGMVVTFTSLTGGTGLATGVSYYVTNASGATCKLSLTMGGAAINFASDITAGAVVVSLDMRVWSAEFRDTFQSSANGKLDVGARTSEGIAMAGPGVISSLSIDVGPPAVYTPTITKNSDEVDHVPLRQTLLNKTFWVFDRGASFTPRYLFAEYQEGDIIATSPPNTP